MSSAQHCLYSTGFPVMVIIQRYYYFHLIDENMKAQRSQFPGPRSWKQPWITPLQSCHAVLVPPACGCHYQVIHSLAIQSFAWAFIMHDPRLWQVLTLLLSSSRSMSSLCCPTPTWSTCLMPPASTLPSSVPTSNTASVSKPSRKSFSRTCPAATALLPWNISQPRTTASTKKPTTRGRHAVGEVPLAVWGPAFKFKIEPCFFGLFLFISLAQPSCPHYRDLGQGSSQSLSAPQPCIPRG